MRSIFNHMHELHQGQSFPATGLAGPWGSGRLRLLDFLDFRHYDGGKVVTPKHRPSLSPGHTVPSVASDKIPSDTTGDQSRDPPTSSAVP
jgi:hypothetical protein